MDCKENARDERNDVIADSAKQRVKQNADRRMEKDIAQVVKQRIESAHGIGENIRRKHDWAIEITRPNANVENIAEVRKMFDVRILDDMKTIVDGKVILNGVSENDSR